MGPDALVDYVLRQTEISVTDATDTTRRVSPARSYLGDGRCVSWWPKRPVGVRVAVDAEIVGVPVPPALRRRFGVTDPALFWPTWTAVEVSCKLRDVPVLQWLATHGLQPDPTIATRTVRLGDAVVCLGALSSLPLAGAPAAGRGASRG
ncbi:MAG: hypothetical protein QOJ90_2116 [Actinomycetota bacterium]|jgi:hypothetical protein|nr:hypothetical protein [Actinomycetota bacterium]